MKELVKEILTQTVSQGSVSELEHVSIVPGTAYYSEEHGTDESGRYVTRRLEARLTYWEKYVKQYLSRDYIIRVRFEERGDEVLGTIDYPARFTLSTEESSDTVVAEWTEPVNLDVL